MNYIVTKLITKDTTHDFYLVGLSADRKKAAALAVEAYQAFRPDASAQNIAMITEWLEFRKEYSFRKDKDNRIQLRITGLEPDTAAAEDKLFSCTGGGENDDALLLAISKRLSEGRTTAVSDGQGHCRVLDQK